MKAILEMKNAECTMQNCCRAVVSPRTMLCFFILTSAFCLQALGQYSIDWSTIDGGGGTRTGGVYSVTGTIGQPDAGQMRGGPFTLTGGFWSIIAAVQTPCVPLLSPAHGHQQRRHLLDRSFDRL